MLKSKITLLVLLFIACCGYTTRMISTSKFKTIAIPVVNNATIKPGLSELLTEQLTDDFTKDRTLKITTIEKADLVLECKIINYEKSPQSYTSEQEISVWKITLGAEINSQDKIKPESDTLSATKTNISSWVTYPSDSLEEYGINKAISKLSQDILRNVLTSW
jgi:hypothetical protein